MRNKISVLFGFILLLFISPIIATHFTSKFQLEKAEQELLNEQEQDLINEQEQELIIEQAESTKTNVIKKSESDKKLVYASNDNNLVVGNDQIEPKKALILFTHSYEAFIPILKSKKGLTDVYHSNSNITAFKDVIKDYFKLNSINAEFLPFDTMGELKKTNRTFSEAYSVVRPSLEAQIKKYDYDIIIDLHRDSASREISTLNYENETYGKLYFVVGEEHPNYSINKAYAQNISSQLNELVPGISRGVISKKGDLVDGIYNQDLSENMVLIELGGIENTEEEINRTISVLSNAISIVLKESSQNITKEA
ncbi:stage II sporulation protein P [Lysinibacillus fusiformis]|uniref:stage II sporulation protein P n=1 Tax=Ureibacillus chungkukjangi TaxID=1202712 RepID=UPI000D35F026|nr:stage II sporulation protein P [Ureibacillus chungkukjangi]MCM3389320.1 stage II sporulation protein P [Ureibacillus chungkukjangi]MDI7743500.1 stage II sporulation protein P [Lysinibacillus fusiformis]